MTTKSVDLAHLRSIALAGHSGSGKTTLAENLLFKTGAIPRLGKVDDGTAALDFEPEEHRRKETLSAAVATFDDDGTIVTMVDTPGYPDFVAEVVSAMAACDGALLVVDASGGVEAGLEAAVGQARAWGRAACFFINKCDRENADPLAALDALRVAFGPKVAPLQLAIGAAESFSGYVDLVHRRAWQWDGRQENEIPIPAGTFLMGAPPDEDYSEDYEGPQREVEIIRRRVTSSSETLAVQVANAVARMRNTDVQKPPGIAEAIDWLAALSLLGTEQLDVHAIDRTLGSVLKYSEDQEVIRAAGLEQLVRGRD